MIRSWVKTKAAGALSRTGMDRAAGGFATRANRNAVVIGYHRVVEDFAASAATSIPSMLVTRQMLAWHLDWIGRRYRFASLDELGARLAGGDSGSDPIAAITFDDGYRDFYDLAFPLLQRKGIPAAVFVVTDLVSTTRVQIHDKLYLLLARRAAVRGCGPGPLARLLEGFGIPLANIVAATPYQATRTLIETLPQESLQRVVETLESEAPVAEDTYGPFHALTWDMLARLQKRGVTVGSHTRTHILMTNESGSRVADELTGSRREIEKRLGTDVRHFAYPSGQFHRSTVKAVADAGYQFAYTVCSHQDAGHPRLTVPRTLLWENSCRDFRGVFSGDIMSCQVHRAFDLVAGCRQRHRAPEEAGHAIQ